MKRICSLFLTLIMIMSLCLSASAAAESSLPTIDQSKTGSLTIYKYDLTSAQADGLTDQVYLSTGQANDEAAAAFAPYAIPGVEFTYLRVGAIDTYTVSDGTTNTIQVIYGVEDDDLLSALGLTTSDRVTVKDGVSYYASDTLIDALSDRLSSNNTSTKDALEALISENDAAVSMSLTDSTGKTSVSGLELGLYLVVETSVPENVTYTVDPFFVSVPMTDTQTLNRWFYDVTVYPKNQTGNPTLEKEVADTAHGLSFSDASEGYEDVATVSDNDLVNYRILSTLPSVHSAATYLTQYTFVDTLSKGLEYNEGDVKICWYRDYADALADYSAATENSEAVNGGNADATWEYGSEFFSVSYGTASEDATTMTVELTAAGLKEVNTPASSDDQEGKYSCWTMVIYYNATVHADEAVTYGDDGNPNEVTLTWSRTTDGYYDTLEDEAIVYSYGIDLTKVLSEGGTDFSSVQFVLQNTSNDTGAYYVVASAAESGVYYVTGGTDLERDATCLSPDSDGRLRIYGLEEDTYVLTEVQTASGYTLLKDSITIVISTDYTSGGACGSLTASATVDGNEVDMESDGDSANALVPLTVLNSRGFDLPQTGGAGTLVTTVCGGLLTAAMVALAIFTLRRKKSA
ncbi:MAG: SpaH/EbpB family LPXTG-anchored major pilin [Clostridiales bacterium]|nr:SpaH/EbpB family LPXTG-anchored major pilin [Clostridiales bacterium]